MKKILFAILLFISINTMAQPQITWKNPIADETEALTTPSGKTIRIVTSNDTIFKLLIKKFSNYTKLYITNKKDRKGTYQQATLYYGNTEACKVIEYLKTLK